MLFLAISNKNFDVFSIWTDAEPVDGQLLYRV
jgi:hypothetical protein